VFHCDRDQAVPFQEGRLIAAGIAKAKFVPLTSCNHVLLSSEPAWEVFVRELGDFLGWRNSSLTDFSSALKLWTLAAVTLARSMSGLFLRAK
jgi:hypothetical protein